MKLNRYNTYFYLLIFRGSHLGKRLPLIKTEVIKDTLDATAVDNEVKEYKLSDERRKLLAAETYGSSRPS